MESSELKGRQARWPEDVFVHPCVLLNYNDDKVQELLDIHSSPSNGNGAADNLGLVFKKHVGMHRALDDAEALQRANWVVLHNPILGSPGNYDLGILFSVLLRLKANARVVIVLDRGRIQGIGAWNTLLEAGFVPAAPAGERLVEREHRAPAASLKEALERVAVLLAVSNPKLISEIGKLPWGATFPESLSEEGALALCQHPDGAVRAQAIVRVGQTSEAPKSLKREPGPQQASARA